mgnify:CR=1 FL=1
MVKVKRLRAKPTATKSRMWDALPWKAVDVDRENLGDFEESVFFGLEEIDGNAYKLSKTGDNGMRPEAVIESDEVPVEKAAKKVKKGKKSQQAAIETEADVDDAESAEEPVEPVASTKKTSKKRKQATLVNLSEIEDAVVEPDAAPVTDKKKKQKKAKTQAVEAVEKDDEEIEEEGARIGSLKALYINAPAALVTEDVSYLKSDSEWAPGLQLSDLLTQALVALGFETPTPIQISAIPLATHGGTEIVGAAETGSGKTAGECFHVYFLSAHDMSV